MLVAAAVTANAQAYWGARIAYDATFPSTYKAGDAEFDLFRNGGGLSAGAICNIPLMAGLYLEPGASLYYNSYRYSDLTINVDADDGYHIFDPKVKKTGVRIPVRLGYYFDIFPDRGGLAVFTGPSFDYALSGKLGIDKDICEKYEIERNIFSEPWGMHRASMAWTVGADIYVGPWVVDICGSFGLTDLQRGPGSFREYRLSIGLGYNF